MNLHLNQLFTRVTLSAVAVAGLILVPGCAAPSSNLAGPGNADASKSSLDQVLSGHDTIGRTLTQPAAPAPEAAPAAAPVAVPKPGTVAGYFPSGRPEGSGLLVEKTAPSQVLAGQPYSYSYKVSNLTPATLETVVVSDRVGANFASTDSTPKATTASGGNATWSLGTFGPKEVKTIVVNGSSADEGVVTTCGSATYNPVICQDIQVVKANIQLSKTEPADVSICDAIPTVLTVKNSGSSALTGVQVTDDLPTGLTSDGKSSLKFDVGNLAPGESRELKYNAAASATGKLASTAKVTSAEGVTAEAAAATTVHQAVLAITCKAADQQYIGRNFDVVYTVSNTGDAQATGANLVVPVPAGLNLVSSSPVGQLADGKISWNLGTVDSAAPQTITATFNSTAAGSFDFNSTVKGACAAAASSSCSTKVVGIPAILLEKADNPDPVAVGETTTYTVKVTNQGSANDANVHVIVTVDGELVPISSSEGTINGQVVDLPVVPILAPKAAVTYTIVAKGVKAGGAVTKFSLSSEMLTSPITAEESTTVY